MKSRKNPCARELKKQITPRLDPEVIQYFREKSEEKGTPYQTLINLYLQDCRATGHEDEVDQVRRMVHFRRTEEWDECVE